MRLCWAYLVFRFVWKEPLLPIMQMASSRCACANQKLVLSVVPQTNDTLHPHEVRYSSADVFNLKYHNWVVMHPQEWPYIELFE
mmetsp:Transcript_105263/g.181543  ORF Transcript_105263/g.181543 Transcript_105263/m.181543 type:complete len:84 (+) Transcript_105263:474-725(+)